MSTTLFNPVMPAQNAYRLGAFARTKGKKSLIKRGKSLNTPDSSATENLKKLKALQGGK